MAVSGDLLKLGTRPSSPPDPHANELRALVAGSSRRYAQPEDSEASPWLVDQDDLEAVLNGLAHRSRTLEELGGISGLRADKLAAVLRRAEEAGDVERDEAEGRLRLTPRGSVHLSALQARRNEGEDHVGTLVDLVMRLGTRHIAATIPVQVAGVLTPDGQFRYGDAVYNIEVECSTVAKAAEQVVRNVRKAREAGNRVLIALPDGSGVQRVLAVLDSAFPGIRLWPDGVGLVWKGEDGAFGPTGFPGPKFGRSLKRGTSRCRSPFKIGRGKPRTPRPNWSIPTPESPWSVRLSRAFLRERRTEITSKELVTFLPEPERRGTAISKSEPSWGCWEREVGGSGWKGRGLVSTKSAVLGASPFPEGSDQQDRSGSRSGQEDPNEAWRVDRAGSDEKPGSDRRDRSGPTD